MISNKKNLVIEIISSAFVILFIYAALSKWLEYDKFRFQIGQSPVLTGFEDIIVWSLPATEIVIALLLTTTRSRLVALYAAFTLMVMFTAYIIIITRFADYIPCSCGGVLSTLNWNEHLVFNIAFAALAAVAILIYPKDILLQWKQDNAENLEESRHDV